MRACAIAVMVAASGCGDNVPGPGKPIEHAPIMFITAHRDDDMIFMQPELLDALASGPVTTVYVASGDPKGLDNAEKLLSGARYAYGAVLGSDQWDCGYTPVAGRAVHHCRLFDRPVSLIGLDMPDGGLEGEMHVSLLHLVEGKLPDVPIISPVGGRADEQQIIRELAAVIEATDPSEIHTLDLAATHGRDHSSHLMAASFTMWALGSVGYSGALRWHRGYNVDGTPITLPDDEFARAADMLGYYDACYFGCARCGTSCKKLDVTHDAWMHRQYSFDRVLPGKSVALSTTGANGPTCIVVGRGVRLVLGDCASPTSFVLEPSGHLVADELCAASARDGSVTLQPCATVPEQYWLLDSEGHLWNGAPPDPASGMDYDHTRCLAPDVTGTVVNAPTCGLSLQPTWTFSAN